ncbi:unnamed protein product [Effrenium voratum]|uniref:Uncharacterized protein n=1 Tax=Effrenium voratum TaxID=2562239 RepID=A0AA36NER7_9DINO|nr:unnamed protein product [Effrenium voratum]
MPADETALSLLEPPAKRFAVTARSDNVIELTMVKAKGTHGGVNFSHVEDLLVLHDLGVEELYEWNNRLPAEPVVRAMDRVLAVNDESGRAEEMLAKFVEGEEVKLTLQHARHFSLNLKRNGQPLGLEVQAVENLGVVILNVKEGIMEDYNKTGAGTAIEAYSCIYAVDGKEYSSRRPKEGTK